MLSMKSVCPICHFCTRLYRSRLFRYFCFLFSSLSILFLSLMPSHAVDSNFSPKVQLWDLPFHTLAYFTITASAILALRSSSKPLTALVRLQFLTVYVLIGAVLELLQTTPWVGRACTLTDFYSNLIGASLAALIIRTKWLLPFPSATAPVSMP